MDKIAKLMALNMAKDLDSDHQIEALSVIGLPSSEIALVVGKSPNAIRIALHRIRKGALKQKKSLSTQQRK